MVVFENNCTPKNLQMKWRWFILLPALIFLFLFKQKTELHIEHQCQFIGQYLVSGNKRLVDELKKKKEITFSFFLSACNRNCIFYAAKTSPFYQVEGCHKNLT